MKLHEKLRQLRKEHKIKMKELHKRLVNIFGYRALKYNTLYRIEKGLTEPRGSSLHQICTGLGISLKELKEETEEEPKLVDIIRHNKRLDTFYFNEKAYAQMLISPKRGFMVKEFVLAPAGSTKLEEDPIEVGKFEKWVYILQGILDAHVGQDVYSISRGDCLSFQSNIPHYFENKSNKRARFIVVQNPKYI